MRSLAGLIIRRFCRPLNQEYMKTRIMNRIISSALTTSALIFGVFLPREEAVAQTAFRDNVWAFMAGDAQEKDAAGDAQEKDAVDQQTLQQLEAKRKKYDEAVNNHDT